MSLPWRDADPSDFCASDVPTATQRAAVILRTWAVFALSGVLSIPRHSRTTRNNVLLSSPRMHAKHPRSTATDCTAASRVPRERARSVYSEHRRTKTAHYSFMLTAYAEPIERPRSTAHAALVFDACGSPTDRH